jgi:phenylpyruvate tautomerase PptA (4-oxalocrotonate tautomerase family)
MLNFELCWFNIMAQVKVYGVKSVLDTIKPQLSNVIHQCVVTALQMPPEKRFHRFFGLALEDFCYPSDRSQQYTIIEISLMAGRSVETKKALIRLLFDQLQQQLGLAPVDVEITLIETPKCNWGIRGQCGDEMMLNYQVEI